jgi:hypothetical protein
LAQRPQDKKKKHRLIWPQQQKLAQQKQAQQM